MAEIQFSNYYEAQDALKLNCPIIDEMNGDRYIGLESIKLITETDSYNYEMYNFKKIFVAGRGPKSSPGHPCAHQRPVNQKMIDYANLNRKPIHVFHENELNKIIYRGLYQIHEITTQLTHAGWVYYQIELERLKVPDTREII